MKSVLISIQPYYVFLIIARIMGWNIPQQKTVEVRKDFPKDPEWNKRVHIYCSKDKQSFNHLPKQYQPLMEKFLGKVIGEFMCDYIDRVTAYKAYDKNSKKVYDRYDIDDYHLNQTCLTIDELMVYGKDRPFYGWHISDLKIYDALKELGEFNAVCPYKKPDGTRMNVDCPCDKYTWDFDEEKGKAYCTRRIIRPPQSWCCVEEL